VLRRAAGRFDALVTVDRGLPAQASPGAAGIAMVLIAAPSNRLAALLPLVPAVLDALARIAPGDVARVPGPP